MGLELRKDSKWWYGRYSVNGQRYCVNLDVEVRGRRPASKDEAGDATFENSRGAAALALKRQVAEARSQKAAVRHLEEIYAIKSGQPLASIRLSDMYDLWHKTARQAELSQQYVQTMRHLVKRFTDFVARSHPSLRTLAQVTPAVAREFMATVSVNPKVNRPVTAATYNAAAHMMRSIFNKLAPEAGPTANPFRLIPRRPDNGKHRQPLTVEQLRLVLDAAPPLVRPLILTGMCTAMRCADCCLLKWSDVDLRQNFIRVKTSKTGETAEIPIFPLLRRDLESRMPTDGYVFPDVAAQFLRCRDTITAQTRKAFAATGVDDPAAGPTTVRRVRVHDFHSLRTTWITIALTAGVPMELVRRVTGHQTVDIVLKHYFRPGRQEFQRVVLGSMPRLLTGESEPPANGTGAPKTPAQSVIDILSAAAPDNWRDAVARAIEALRRIDAQVVTA